MGNSGVKNPAPKLSLAWLFLSVLFLLVTVATVLWGLRRGFDLTDEGFYLLSNTYYKEYPSFSGFAVLGGWLVEHFHLDVVSLRGLRFLLLIASHAAFSAAAIRWILFRFQLIAEARQLVRWSFFFLVGSVAASYQWAPPSLSYNDWATVFALLAAAGVFWFLAGDLPPVEFARLRSVFLGLIVGLFSGGLFFVRWPAAAATLPLLTFAVIVGGSKGRHVRGSFFFGVIVGGMAALALIHATMVDLGSFLEKSIAVSASMARGDHAPLALLAGYSRQLLTSLTLPWIHFWWVILLFAVLSGSVLRFPLLKNTLELIACGLIGMTLLHGIAAGFFDGAGATYRSVTVQLGLIYMAGAALLSRRILESPENGAKRVGRCGVGLILATRIAARIAAVRTWLTRRRRQIAGLVLLFGLPWVVAFGTDNPLLNPGAQDVVAWKVLLLIPVAALWASPQVRVLGFGIGLLSLIATQTQFLDGYILHPYRLATSLWAQSVPVRNLPRGNRLLFDIETAETLTDLTSRVASLRPGENPPIMAFYDYPGIVYLLGGYSPALPRYYQSNDGHGYTATMLRRRAKLGQPPLSSLHPLILLDRVMDLPMLGVLHEFEIDFLSGYREIGAFRFPFGRRVIYLFAPRDLDSNPQPGQGSH